MWGICGGLREMGAEPPVGDAQPAPESRLRAGPDCLLLCSVFVRQVSEKLGKLLGKWNRET